MRDWSDEGEEERRQSYEPVIEELERLCPVNPDPKGTQKVLVPGAGLGRLTLEIVSRGYGCAGTCRWTAVICPLFMSFVGLLFDRMAAQARRSLYFHAFMSIPQKTLLFG